MKKILLFISIIFVSLVVSGCSNKEQKTYRYLDGNGNKYTISEKTLEYLPLDTASSSSGLYDGGVYKKINISAVDYKKIVSLFEQAITDTSIHIENRVMESGLIVVEKNNQSTSFIIKPGSDKKSQIEQTLKGFLTN